MQATHLLSPNPHTTQVLVEQHDVQGILPTELLELGYPRIDLTLSAQQAEQVSHQLDLDSTKKVVLYAPTYRGSTQGQAQLEEEPINALLTALAQEESVEVFFKGHHMIEQALVDSGIKARLVPAGMDTNVFLSVVDVLITDYSSILFDFLPRKKPIVLYAYDYERYREQRGLYLQADEMPGVLCGSVEQVVEQVRKVDTELEATSWHQHMARFCPFDDGQVTQRVWERFLDNERCLTKPSSKKTLLIYAGALMLNGITVSLRNLVRQLDAEQYNVYLAIEPSSFVSPDQFEQLEEVRPYVKVLSRFGRVNWTLEEHWLMERFHAWHSLPSDEMESVLCRAYQREARRLYGSVQFDAVINFEGYVRYWALLFAHMPNNRIYLHNDMYNEWRTRFPTQESVFNLYDKYQKLISVSASTNTQNKRQLAETYKIDEVKFVYADNVLNPEFVIQGSKDELRADIACFVDDAQPESTKLL